MSQHWTPVQVVRRRRISLGALLVAMVMVPVAIAYACNPQAQIRLDSRSYQPGSTISVSGAYFPNTANVTVAGPVGTQVVRPSGGGFRTTLTAPDAPGDYTITASRATGGFAPASFSVAAPAPTPPPAAAPTAPPAAAPTAPAVQSFPSDGSTAPQRSFRPPLILPIEGGSTADQPRSEGRGEQETARPETNAAPVQTAPSGQQVFAGPAPTFAAPTFRAPTFTAPAFAATAPATAPSFAAPATRERTSARSESGPARSASGSRSTEAEPAGASPAQAPADQAALSDLFSAYEPGRTASLMDDGATGMSDGGAGSGLGLGIGLLAFGLVALVAGLTAVEVRRRRLLA